MSYFAIFILALAMSVDASIVSFSYGLKYSSNQVKTASSLALTTGLFQAFMPVIGYLLTETVKSYIQPYGKLIAFLIFMYLGIKFITESFHKDKKHIYSISLKCLILIGIATSIDAFSAGITLSVLGNKILKPALLIGIITYINALIGFWIGAKFRHMPSFLLEIFAGCLLILLGIKSII